MSYFGSSDFYLRVQQGLVTGYAAVLKFGRNSDVDTGGLEDIWTGGGTWVQPTAARVHDIVSSSANDDGSPAGTGAQTVKVMGLDGTYALAEETITMDGTTNVATVGSYIIIYRMYVVTAGSGGANAGAITATAQTDATVTARIEIGDNQTLMAVYQIPAGKTGYITHYYGSMNNSVTATSGDLRLMVKPFGEVYQIKHLLGLISTGSSLVDYQLEIPMALTEKSLVKITAETSGNNVDISAGFDIVLVDN